MFAVLICWSVVLGHVDMHVDPSFYDISPSFYDTLVRCFVTVGKIRTRHSDLGDEVPELCKVSAQFEDSSNDLHYLT